MNTTTTTISTKATAAHEAVDTALTISWEGMTPDDIRNLAQAHLIVKYQAGIRKAATAEVPTPIPTSATINATDYRVGTRAPKASPVETIKAMLAAMSPEERARWIAANLGN